MTNPVTQKAREYASALMERVGTTRRLTPQEAEIIAGGAYEAGYRAFAAPLSEEEIEAVARAILGEMEGRDPEEIVAGKPRWTYYRGDASAAYSTLLKLRGI